MQTSSFSQAEKVQIHADLARSYLQRKQYDVAQQELETALGIDDNHAETNYLMALLQLQLQQNNLAESFFNKAVNLDPDNSVAVHDFAMFLCQTDREVQSLAYFDKAANNTLFGKRELSFARAGECLARVGDDRAEAYLTEALSIDADLDVALYHMAELKYRSQSFSLARDYLQRYMVVVEQDPSILQFAYEIEVALGSDEKAETYRQLLLDNYPKSSQADALR